MYFILRRLVFYAIAAWVALTINFFIPRAMPGNAVEAIRLGADAARLQCLHDLVGIAGEGRGHGNSHHLDRGQPRRERAAEVLDQHSKEPFQ